MASVLVTVSVHYSPHGRVRGPDSTGIWASSAEEVAELGQASSLPISLNQGVAKLEFTGAESDVRLIKLYEAIWDRYGLKPQMHNVIPVNERNLYFGVKRKVTWTKKEIDGCDLLWLSGGQFIACHGEATAEQLMREDYVAKLDFRQRSAVLFGSCWPFGGVFALAEPLRSILLEEELAGLYLPPVSFVPENRKVGKPLWAVRSSVILPRALNLLQGELGNPAEPNTEWGCYLDDGGRVPPVWRYRRSEVESLRPFDIAMTFERLGPHLRAAYRSCIVSQRFRETLTKYKVKGVEYVPVELV